MSVDKMKLVMESSKPFRTESVINKISQRSFFSYTSTIPLFCLKFCKLNTIYTMDFTSLNYDVILCILKWIHPVDRFNVILSGLLPGFQALIVDINPTEWYVFFRSLVT